MMDISDDCPPPGTEGYEEFANNQRILPTGGGGGRDEGGDGDEGGGGTSAEKKRKLGSFLQSHSIKLEDGSSHAALDYVEQDGMSAYLCFPCAVTCYTEITLQAHLNGKAHANKLSLGNVYPSSIITNHPFLKKKKTIAVPENIPLPVEAGEPQHQQEKEPARLWRSLTYYKQSPVVGLEYILEITSDYGALAYFCTLCEKNGDSNTIVNHIVGSKHKLNYMRIHYPTAHRALQVYMKDFQKFKGTVQVIHNICNCIEQAYGRLPPTVVESHQFVRNRSKYIKELSQAQHFSERDGGTFEDLVDGEYIMLLSEKGTSGGGDET